MRIEYLPYSEWQEIDNSRKIDKGKKFYLKTNGDLVEVKIL